MENSCFNSNNLTFENKDKSIILSLLILKALLKFSQTWFNKFTWIFQLHLAPPGGAEFSLVEPALDQPIKDRCANYDIIIWFQAYWDKIVV